MFEDLLLLRMAKPIINLLARLSSGEWPWDDTARDAVDIAESLGGGWGERRRFARQLDGAATTVAEQLADYIGSAFPTLPQNDVEAAVIAAGDTLAAMGRWTKPRLVECVTAPEQTLDELLEAGGSRLRGQLYSSGAEALFDVLLPRAVHYISDLALLLPDFTQQALRNLLRQQRDLDAVIAEVFERLPPDEAGSSEPDMRRFLTSYRTAVAKNLDFLEVAGADLESVRRRYQLTTAYVALQVRSFSASDHEDAPEGVREVEIEDLLEGVRRLILIGEPGAGKSTVLKWIAVTAAREKFSQRLVTWNGRVPFLVKARRLSGRPPAIEELGGELTAGAGRAPDGWCHDLMQAGRAILLVDGLDEVNADLRGRLLTWIDQVADTYPGTLVVVTTRPSAEAEVRAALPGFVRAEVLPMSLPQLNAFIEYWHRSVLDEEKLGDSDEPPSAIADALRQRLYNDRNLRLLANNPLLAAVICALHVSRRGSLSNRRKEIYSDAIDMLVKRRDDARQIPTGELTIEQRRALLTDLADWMVSTGLVEIPVKDAVPRVGRLLKLFGVESHDAKDSIESLVERSGIIRYSDEDHLEFFHKSFQEYLAAESLVGKREIPSLYNHFHDVEWQQLISWAPAFMNEEDAALFFGALLQEVERRAPDDRNRLLILALACAENALFLEGSVRGAVYELGQELIPPRSMEAVGALVATGEATAPLLAQRAAVETEQASLELTAEALIRIGGEHALYGLASLPRPQKLRIAQRLAAGWGYFDPGAFASVILADVPTEGPPLDILIRDPRLLAEAHHVSSAYRVSAQLSAHQLLHLDVGDQQLRVHVLRVADLDLATQGGQLHQFRSISLLVLVDPAALLWSEWNEEDDKASPPSSIDVARVESGSMRSMDVAALAQFLEPRELELAGRIDLQGLDRLDQAPTSALRLAIGSSPSLLAEWNGWLSEVEVRDWPGDDLVPLSGLTGVSRLSLIESASLASLDGLRGFNDIETLLLVGCDELEDGQALRDLPGLRLLDLTDCRAFFDAELIEELSDGVEVRTEGSGVAAGYRDREPEVVFERWAFWPLEDTGDDEMAARGWDDIGFMTDEVREDYGDIWPEVTYYVDGERLDVEAMTIIDSLREWEAPVDELDSSAAAVPPGHPTPD